MSLRLSNRFALAADGWIQLSPLGEWPHSSGVMQVVDAVAVAELANGYAGEVLLDFDHESRDPSKRTTAAGWIDRVAARQDGLWGHVRWSEAGERAVANGEYRFVSPVWDVEELGEARVRPTRLLEAGLTNKPNIKTILPISNRGTDAAEEKTNGGGNSAATKEKNETMKLINRALDLSPDASEEAATAGIDGLKKERAEAKQTLANRETELASVKETLANRETEIAGLKALVASADAAAVEAEVAGAGITDEGERATWKGLLLANREEGRKALAGFAAARKASEKPLTNRQSAQTPDDKTEHTANTAKAAMKAQISQD